MTGFSRTAACFLATAVLWTAAQAIGGTGGALSSDESHPGQDLIADVERITAAGLGSVVRVIRGDLDPSSDHRLIGTGVSLGGGLILTCAGVVGGAPEVLVASVHGDTLVARVRGVDRRSNLALLEAPGLNLPALPVNREALILPGTWVVAVGLGSSGVPSSTFGSVVLDGGPSLGFSEVDMIQTTNPVFRGYTGGALINRAGELVGIVSGVLEQPVTQLIVPEGTDLMAGFVMNGMLRTLTPDASTVALPAVRALQVAEELAEKGYVERGYLGLQVELSRAAARVRQNRSQGILVHQVVPGGPAERSGLIPGDFILEFGGVRVFSPDDLSFLVASRRPQVTARVKFLRRGSVQIVTVRLDQAPALEWEPAWDAALAGRETDAGPEVLSRTR